MLSGNTELINKVYSWRMAWCDVIKHDLPQFLSSHLGDTDFLMIFGLEYVVCRFEEKNGLSKSYELNSIQSFKLIIVYSNVKTTSTMPDDMKISSNTYIYECIFIYVHSPQECLWVCKAGLACSNVVGIGIMPPPPLRLG